jgi:hypothetical protein
MKNKNFICLIIGIFSIVSIESCGDKADCPDPRACNFNMDSKPTKENLKLCDYTTCYEKKVIVSTLPSSCGALNVLNNNLEYGVLDIDGQPYRMDQFNHRGLELQY